MPKKIQLQIPTPCHENWDNMAPVDKGKFCGSCQKQVIDFSRMTDREIALFFKKKTTGSVCGRFADDQLNRDIDIPKKRIPWFKYFFQFVLPALIFSYKAKSQGNIRVSTKDTVMVLPRCSNPPGSNDFLVGDVSFVKEIPVTVKGKVTDEKGDPVPYASIMIKGTQQGVAATASGLFSFPPGAVKKDAILQASSVGYESIEISLTNRNLSDTINIKLQMMVQGNIVITCYQDHFKMGAAVRAISVSEKNKAIIEKKEPVIPVSNIKIFPNPIASGSSLHIQWNAKENGEHTLQVFNTAGQMIWQRELYIDAEAKLLNIDQPALTPGSYIIRIAGKKSTHTEKLIVQ